MESAFQSTELYHEGQSEAAAQRKLIYVSLHFYSTSFSQRSLMGGAQNSPAKITV